MKNSKQIITRVSNDDYKRLNNIVKEYRFKSYYEVMRYLIHCFLRAVDVTYPQDEPLPEEIKQMLNTDRLIKLSKKIAKKKIRQNNEIQREFQEHSDAQSLRYGEFKKHRKSKCQVKYEKEDKI